MKKLLVATLFVSSAALAGGKIDFKTADVNKDNVVNEADVTAAPTATPAVKAEDVSAFIASHDKDADKSVSATEGEHHDKAAKKAEHKK